MLLQALQAMFPAEEGCFTLAPAEQHALEAAEAAVVAGDADAPLLNLSGTIRYTPTIAALTVL
jgi:hypothetical protein